MLETSALDSLYGGQITSSTQLIHVKPNIRFHSPPMHKAHKVFKKTIPCRLDLITVIAVCLSERANNELKGFSNNRNHSFA